ncbi:MAG TPA: histidinol-phosphate transaminase [Lentisphaeria bacterium]|nr:MAG: histidinol-phosphate transaminase [Lentisphaerae bacterium GWF2_50_93]HCE45834.1 histidinol-phosphate transaminase [Lentisphaeria bacterium]
MSKQKSYFRNNIDAMSGYTPGEQPKDMKYVKLNTNENPYPPSPAVAKAMKSFCTDRLRLYPDPLACELRKTIADIFRLKPENIIVGNGSDDILTITTRAFVGEGEPLASFEPSYSLYPVLAELQACRCIKIPLRYDGDFHIPPDSAEKAKDARLFYIARPNAPTGTLFPIDEIKKICRKFKGVVFVDEAYADFADDNCVGLLKEFPNLIVGRTLSKSYSLAGLRLGYALASREIIEGMMKVKDSYNVGMLVQALAVAALKDRKYFNETKKKICRTRAFLVKSLNEKGFEVCGSQSNFVFAAPPDNDGGGLYRRLKKNGILVRYFKGPVTGRFVRITVGTDGEIRTLLRNT